MITVFCAIATGLILGCHSSTGPQAPTVYSAQDYSPFVDNQVISARVVGNKTSFSQSGNLLGIDQFDQVTTALLGPHQVLDGKIVYPVFANDLNKQPFNGGYPVGYVGVDTSGIYAFNTINPNRGTLLQGRFSTADSWTFVPSLLPRRNAQLNLVQHFDNFLDTVSGHAYTNVLKIHAIYADSSVGPNSYVREIGEGYFFFAYGVGFIGMQILNFEHTSYEIAGPSYYHWQHYFVTASIWRNL
jgi:hypothetical protein